MSRIKKIISGCQTGADRAALDFAVDLGIPYGGSVPKGRKAEDGIIPEKYDQLQEMATANYPARTEQNILDSHGTLIISHGKLTGGSLRTKKLALQHERAYLHIDLTKTNPFIAAGKIINWITGNGIEILNVAGQRASKDQKSYEGTLEVLKAFHDMATWKDQTISLPRTFVEAVESMIAAMTLRDKTKLARMPEEDLILLHPTLGAWIRDKF